MRKIFTIFLLVSMMCVSICGCSSASARQETLLTTEEKTEVDALETAITATDANQTIEEPEEVVRHTEGVDGFSDDIDYLSIMKQSCLNGDYEAGVVAEKARNKKIDVLGLNVTKVFFEDLLELSKIITAECGDKRLPFEWKLAVGEVVINRADSPEFPDTIKEVIHAEGQYANANTDYFKNLTPFEPCVEAAARLLSGERVLMNRQSYSSLVGYKVAAFILNCTAAITAIPICVIAVTQNFTEVK